MFPKLGLALVLAISAAHPAVKAQLVGGTVAGMEPRGSANLDLTGQESLVLRCGKITLNVPYAKVNTVEYGQTVSRRYAEAILISPVLLLAKSRKHFVTLGYLDESGK